MKTTLVILASLFLFTSAFADQNITAYTGSTPQSPVRRGCVQIVLVGVSFSGKIGNATFSSFTNVILLSAVGDGQTLGELSYTVTGGTLHVVEIR